MINIVDLHIHSKYSRATSSKSDLEHLNFYSKIKGINVVGTGDFTHPKWIKEIENKLEITSNGFYKIKKEFNNIEIEKEFFNSEKNIFNKEIYFIPTAEISCIFKHNEKTKKLHLILVAPNLEIVKKINKKLSEIGNLHSDGRPILGLHAKELLKICLSISEDILFIPAHIFTPWFGLYGHKSGFDSIYECFDDLTKYIYAMETGLSADPEMIYKIEEINKFKLLSNSDAHSPENLGREANIFDGELSYKNMINNLKGLDNKLNLISTIEFFPEEGKYYKEVSSRINDLQKRYKTNYKNNYYSIAPLKMIISEILKKRDSSKTVNDMYRKILSFGKNEFEILSFLKEKELKNIFNNINDIEKIINGIIKVRKGEIEKIPGYDGIYGSIKIK